MSTMAMSEAAAHLGVTEATIRSWVLRGYLEPVRRGARPLRFDDMALARCAAKRMSKAEHDRLDALWTQVLDSS